MASAAEQLPPSRHHPYSDEEGDVVENGRSSPPTESEPLLGRPGDALQKPDAPMLRNLWLGTGFLAQIGIILLTILVWSAVFTNKTYPLVSPHPLLQSLGLFTLVQAILLLQPTHTPETKARGQRGHFLLQIFSFFIFTAGIAVIETNKHVNRLAHLHSAHAYLGVITGTLLLVQYLFGFTIWATPGVWGGEDKAKALWKYHRYLGYVLLVSLLATVATAVETPFVKAAMNIKLWAVLLAELFIVVGVFPRVQLRKLGIQRGGA